MKLYISGDMEGVAGVCAWQQVDARNGGADYQIFRRFYTQEIRAAIDGARTSGPHEILVNDSHGPMRNLVFEELPNDVRVIFGNRKPHSMVQDADASFGGAFFIGYHGATGDANAVLCHTYTPSVIHNVHVNGIRCSEATLNAGLLGHYGVPLMLVSGDRSTVEGIQQHMPWVEGVIVKESIGHFAANSISPTAAQRAIALGASAALARAGQMKPFVFKTPVELCIEFAKVEQADLVEMIPGFERNGGRNIRFVSADYPTVFKAFVASFRLGSQA